MLMGLVITDNTLLAHALGLIEAAKRRDWDVRCFLTDKGVLCLNDSRLSSLIDGGQVMTALCELSVERYASDLPHHILDSERIIVGGQYQNAEMVKHCQRTIVL